jgi:hypothetical protein
MKHLYIWNPKTVDMTEFQLRNRYNGKIRVVEKYGEWYAKDFKNNTYVG